jgi:hypothetical protein
MPVISSIESRLFSLKEKINKLRVGQMFSEVLESQGKIDFNFTAQGE